MANEISVSVRLTVSKGSLTLSKTPSIRADMLGSHYDAKAIDVGGSVVSVPIPAAIQDPGWCYLRNLSDTEYIEVSTGSGGSFDAHVFALLEPGNPGLFPMGPNGFYARCMSEYGLTGQLEYVYLER